MSPWNEDKPSDHTMTILDELGTRGRIDRPGFWLRHMLVLPMALALTIATQEVAVALEVAASAALTLLLVSTWARRLHDRGHSAWRLLAVLVPIAGALYLWIECALRKGDPQANPFGPVVGVRADYTTVGDAP